MNQEESNEKILKLMNQEDILSQEEIQLFKELMFQCDLKIQNKYGWIPLVYALIYNQDKNLNLSEEKIDYLIKNSDLTQKNKYGWTPLMYAFKYNKEQNLNLREEQLDYLIKNSDLTQQNKRGWTSLFLAFVNNKTQNLNLSSKQFKTMFDALNEKEKQTTFKNIIQVNHEDDHQYLEEINLFLYELQFQPNKKILSWLKKNNHQDIIQMIEKRNLFFQLNQEFKEIDNHQKYNKIKI